VGILLSDGSERDPNRPGSRRQFRKRGYRTKGEAQAALAKLRASLDADTYVEPSKIPLAATQWLERPQVTGSGLKATTLAGDTHYITRDIASSQVGAMKLIDV
jgi:hypothetical protein